MLKVLQVEKPMGDRERGSDQQMLQSLIQAIAESGDRDAFEALFSRFGPRIKGMMISSGASDDMAEDLVQDVMMTIWRKSALYSPERGNVSTWIYTIARNARIDRLRRQPTQPYVDVDTITLECDAPTAETQVMGSQSDALVREAVDRLPDEQKRVIELAFLRYKPQSTIAEELNVPIGTVKSRMRLAYQKLKEHLEELR